MTIADLRKEIIIQNIEDQFKANEIPFAPALDEVIAKAQKKYPNARIEFVISIIGRWLLEYLDKAIKEANPKEKSIGSVFQWVWNLLFKKSH